MSTVIGTRRSFIAAMTAAYVGVAAMMPELGGRKPRLAGLNVFSESLGPERLGCGPHLLGNEMSRRPSHTPHIGKRQVERARLGGFYTLRRK
jgi:hypothetical protein